jgi:hypothetical protein
MKVKFGPYISRFTTRPLDNLWYKMRYKESNLWLIKDEDKDIWDERYEKVSDFFQTILNATLNKIQDKRQRKVKVKVDYFDVWSADHTLAMIILPVLKKLKEVKHGSPFVENEDVPEHLRSKSEPSVENNYEDDTIHERWEWVLNEMIWAFEQIVDEENEDVFYGYSEDGSILGKRNIDYDALKAHRERIKVGTTLFGKYIRGLWD